MGNPALAWGVAAALLVVSLWLFWEWRTLRNSDSEIRRLRIVESGLRQRLSDEELRREVAQRSFLEERANVRSLEKRLESARWASDQWRSQVDKFKGKSAKGGVL